MTRTDFKRFAVSWTAAHSPYGSTPPPEALSVCFRALEPFTLEDIEAALAAHLRDQDAGRFAPKPADVVRHIRGADDAIVAVAWAEFRQATRSGDIPLDPVLQQVTKRMGGLKYLSDKTSRDLDFMLPQFKALYLATREPARLGIAGPGSARAAAIVSGLAAKITQQ